MMFSLCDIYVSASEMEGFGMSVAQAALVAKPIVSSDKIPFTGFYLKEEAIIVPAGDINGFSEGIEMLIKNKSEREKRGKKIQEKSMGLEWENLTKNFILDLNKKNINISVTEFIQKK